MTKSKYVDWDYLKKTKKLPKQTKRLPPLPPKKITAAERRKGKIEKKAKEQEKFREILKIKQQRETGERFPHVERESCKTAEGYKQHCVRFEEICSTSREAKLQEQRNYRKKKPKEIVDNTLQDPVSS